jgi:hypothetical protein
VRRAGVPARPGKIVIWTIAILPENLNRCKPHFEALAELCLKSCAPFGGT